MGEASGWDETVALNAAQRATVTARRGEARVAVSGAPGYALLTGPWWVFYGAVQRDEIGAGRPGFLLLNRAGSAPVRVEIEPERLEPFLQAMLAAIYFSEG